MSSAASTQKKGPRGSRVKLGGSILALVLLENGRQLRGRMNQLSVNGGLLSLERPLDEAIQVTVVFHLGSTSIRCPRPLCCFPCGPLRDVSSLSRFVELPEADHASLNRELEALVRASTFSGRGRSRVGRNRRDLTCLRPPRSLPANTSATPRSASA